MRKETRDIIDAVLEKEKSHRTFETEHFIYWILSESYIYDYEPISREEFEGVKKYAIHYGTLPSVERRRSGMSDSQVERYKNDINNGHMDGSHPELHGGTYSNEKILRYSKTYDSLELYGFSVNVRSTFMNTSTRVLVMKRKNKIFSVNSKGFVRVGKRWLSLKNCQIISNQSIDVRDKTLKLLLYSMLGKEWAMDCYNQCLSISNKNVRQSNSLEEAVERECGAAPANILKKFFADDISSLIKLYRMVEPNKIHDITNFIKKNKGELIKVSERFHENKAKVLLFCYFVSKDNRCEMQVLFDYFKMALETGTKINIKISSYSTLKRNHDELSRKIMLKLSSKGQRLKISKVFPNIKSINGLDVERIKTVERLNQESAELHHCVHSYKNLINSGDSAIYRLTFESIPYTLQVRACRKKINNEKMSFSEAIDGNYGKDEEYTFTLELNQLKGRYNSNPPEEIRPFLHKMCEENGILTDSVKSLYFRQDSKDKKRVIQIGSKILERIDWMGKVNVIYEGEPVDKLVEECDFDMLF